MTAHTAVKPSTAKKKGASTEQAAELAEARRTIDDLCRDIGRISGRTAP